MQQFAHDGHGQVAALVAEAGVGKSRLVYELTHSPSLDGWLVLECAAVSYGKAMSYLPVVNLLKSYFGITEQDGLQTIRDKVTDKAACARRRAGAGLPALLALLDVPMNDAAWQALDPAERRRRMLDGVRCLLLREARQAATAIDFRRPALDRRRDAGVLDSLVERLGVGTHPAADNL